MIEDLNRRLDVVASKLRYPATWLGDETWIGQSLDDLARIMRSAKSQAHRVSFTSPHDSHSLIEISGDMQFTGLENKFSVKAIGVLAAGANLILSDIHNYPNSPGGDKEVIKVPYLGDGSFVVSVGAVGLALTHNARLSLVYRTEADEIIKSTPENVLTIIR